MYRKDKPARMLEQPTAALLNKHATHFSTRTQKKKTRRATGVYPVCRGRVRVHTPRRHPVHAGPHDGRDRVEGEGPRQLRPHRRQLGGKRRPGVLLLDFERAVFFITTLLE